MNLPSTWKERLALARTLNHLSPPPAPELVEALAGDTNRQVRGYILRQLDHALITEKALDTLADLGPWDSWITPLRHPKTSSATLARISKTRGLGYLQIQHIIDHANTPAEAIETLITNYPEAMMSHIIRPSVSQEKVWSIEFQPHHFVIQAVSKLMRARGVDYHTQLALLCK